VITLIFSAAPAAAQLDMQLGNGWNLSFSGNVNAFLVYETTDGGGTVSNPLGLVTAGETRSFNIRTGLLPAFAVFSLKGHEAGRDLGVTFGFAPEIQCGPSSNAYANRANCQGSQIDMRQVFLTVGGIGGGQILFGRELSLFGRQNILNDMTLFGTGPTGGANSGTTTLGRIGFGYNYPNFNAQFTWSSAAGKRSQLSVGLFDPSEVLTDGDCTVAGNYCETSAPRFEGEWTLKPGGGTMIWANGLVQGAKDVVGDKSLTSYGVGAGVKFAVDRFSVLGSGFYGSGIGTTLNFVNAVDSTGEARTSSGFYAQGLLDLGFGAGSQIGLSYGQNRLRGTDAEPDDLVTNTAIVAGWYHRMSKMLRSTLEFTYNRSSADGAEDNTGYVFSGGWLLLF